MSNTQTEGLIYVPELDLLFTEERILLGKNYQTTKDTLKDQGIAMPTPFQFRALLRHLRDTPEYQELYEGITGVRKPRRANWINARFKEKKDGMYMISEDALINNEYQNQTLKLDDCLMNNRQISLDEWINSTTPDGLPPTNISYGDLYYWHPRDESVARFWSDSGGAVLGCYGDPGGLDSVLGVFSRHAFFPKIQPR